MATAHQLTNVLNEFMSLAEAAKFLGVSHSQVWRYVKEYKKLVAVPIGNAYYVRREDVEKLERIPKGNPAFRAASMAKKRREKAAAKKKSKIS